MINEKFEHLINGYPQDLTSQEVVDFGVHCAGQNLSLDKIITISLTLFKQNKSNCYEFLQFIEKHQISRPNYRDFIHQPYKIKIYNSLAALTLAKALRQSEKEQIDKTVNQSRKYLNLSENVKNTMERSIILLRGFLLYYNGDLVKANNIFSKAYDDLANDKQTNLPVPALLGLAYISFVKKAYAKSLDYYKKAMMAKKSLPVNARLGMGYCFYELQKYQLAQICFKKILKIDPNCANAYIGIAAIRHKDNDFKGYFQNLTKAYRLNPQDPCIVLHIAQHLFFSGQKQKALVICERGLTFVENMPKFLKCDQNTRNDYQTIKARFNNLIAQIHHMNQEYDLALKYYLQAKGKGLKYNDIGLAQVYIQANMLKQALSIYESIFNNLSTKQSKLIGDNFKTLAYLQMKIGRYTINNPNFYFKESLKFNKNDYEAHIDYFVYLSETNNKQKSLKILLQAKSILQKKNVDLNPELLNNIGVYFLETKKYNEALQILQKSVQKIQQLSKVNLADQLRSNSLTLVCNYNLGIALQKMNQFSSAVQKYEGLITKNKYYMDAYSRLAQIHFKYLGNRQQAMNLLESALKIADQLKTANTSSRMIQALRMDKILTLKAHFLHLDNRNGEAKQILRKMGKKKFAYEHFYEICLGYETIMKKNLEMMVIKDFLRPNRQYCVSICKHESNNFYSYMLLIILLMTDHKINREQAALFFNQLKVGQLEFPQILFNFGIFQLKNGDYENALFSFNRYQEKTRSQKTKQYIVLAEFLSGNYHKAIRTVKNNILSEPNNLKFRFQYAFLIQKWVQKVHQEQNDFKQLKKTEANLIMCKQIYGKLSKVHPADYIKPIQNPDMKQKIKNQISKIRSMSEDRNRFVQSQLEHYAKKKGQISEKQQKFMEEQEKKLEELEKAKKTKELLQKFNEEMEVEDQQKQKARKRRERLQEMSRVQSEIALKAWGQIEEKHKQQLEQKKNKKAAAKKSQKRQRRVQPLQKVQQQYPSQGQYPDIDSRNDEYEDQQISYEKKKKKKDKKNKQKKHRKKDKKRRKQKNNSDDGNDNISQGDQASLSAKSSLDGQSDNSKPRKQRKPEKDDEEDDLGIQFGKYMVDD